MRRMEGPPLNPYAAPAAALDTGGAGRAPASGDYRPLFGRANAVTVLMGLDLLAHALLAANAAITIVVLNRVLAHQHVERATLLAIDQRNAIIGRAIMAIVLGEIIAFCMFTYRAGGNAHSYGQMPMESSPGWAVGWYFIPMVSLWKPYQALVEIWRASEPAADERLELRLAPVPGLLPAWWGAFLVHNLLWQISSWIGQAHGARSLIELSYYRIVAAIGTVVATLLAIAVARALARRQDACQKAAEAYRASRRSPVPAAPVS
jgi:hypothetical protein